MINGDNIKLKFNIKQVRELMNLINKVGGIEKAREIVDNHKSCVLPSVFKYWSNNLNDYVLGTKYATVLIEDLRTAIAQHYQEFEKFLTDNGMPISKGKDGYLFSNRLVYKAWVKSPELGLRKIYELKNTKIYLQGGYK